MFGTISFLFTLEQIYIGIFFDIIIVFESNNKYTLAKFYDIVNFFIFNFIILHFEGLLFLVISY